MPCLCYKFISYIIKTFDSDGGYFRHRAANISHPMAKIPFFFSKQTLGLQ